MSITVTALGCHSCGDLIYSRARHDFHSCTCGRIFIDGGRDYTRCGTTPDAKATFVYDFEVEGSERDLVLDWSRGRSKYGWVHGYVPIDKPS